MDNQGNKRLTRSVVNRDLRPFGAGKMFRGGARARVNGKGWYRATEGVVCRPASLQVTSTLHSVRAMGYSLSINPEGIEVTGKSQSIFAGNKGSNDFNSIECAG